MLQARASAAARAAALLLTTLAGPGCTVFADYNAATEDARAAFQAGDFAGALAEYRDHLDDTNDSLLYHLEAGLTAQVGGDYAESTALLARAHRKVVDYQERALISASDAAQTLGSILVNEKTIPYTGAVFEQLLLQSYQARNLYLSGARHEVLPEILRTYDIQDRARRIYEEELATTQREAEAKRGELDTGEITSKMRAAYAYGDAPSSPEDVYDPRYVRYVNAWLREAVADRQADYNAALIDLKRVAERFGDVPFIQRDLARMTAASGDRAGARELLRDAGLEPLPDDAGSVTLFFESGSAPYKEELKVIFPTYRGAAAFAMPIYKPSTSRVTGARLLVGGEEARTVVLSNVEEMAFQYHRDRLPLMIAKQILRIAAKVALQEGGHSVIENQKGDEAQILAWVWTLSASIWNVVSEQADLRCWRTLPEYLSAARVYLPPGRYPAAVVLLDAAGNPVTKYDLGEVTIAPRRHRMINARAVGSGLFWDLPAEPYDPAPAPPAAPTGPTAAAALPSAPVETVTRVDVLQEGAAPAAVEYDPEAPRIEDVLVAEEQAAAAPTAAPEAPPAADERVREDVLRDEPRVEDVLAGPASAQAVQDAFLQGAMSLEVTFARDKGAPWRGNVAVAAALLEQDARGPFVTVTTAPYQRDGQRYCFELAVRGQRVERLDLLTEREGAWVRVPAQVFHWRPRGPGSVTHTVSGVEAIQPAVCSVARGQAKKGQATLVVRSYLLRGADALGF